MVAIADALASRVVELCPNIGRVPRAGRQPERKQEVIPVTQARCRGEILKKFQPRQDFVFSCSLLTAALLIPVSAYTLKYGPALPAPPPPPPEGSVGTGAGASVEEGGMGATVEEGGMGASVEEGGTGTLVEDGAPH